MIITELEHLKPQVFKVLHLSGGQLRFKNTSDIVYKNVWTPHSYV